MRDSTGQDRRTRQIDLHVLYHDVLVHFGVRMWRRERGVCDVVGEELEGDRDGDRMVGAIEVV